MISKRSTDLSNRSISAYLPEILEDTVDLFLADSSGGDARGSEVWPEFPGFTIVEKIGKGGFGVVYRATDDRLERDVAIKVLSQKLRYRPTARETFVREACALAAIRHPNVLTIHTVLSDADVNAAEPIAMVTELIDGLSLEELVDQLGPLSAAETAQIGIETCRALRAVHARGVVHRDIKSANILRENGGRIVLVDFGLGLLLSRDNGAREPEDRRLVGSPLFMAPEQISGDPVDGRTDLYGLGATLYHLATGEYPIQRNELDCLLDAIGSGCVLPLGDSRPDLPAEFVRVVEKALSRDPGQRFQSAGEMERALLGVVARAESA